VPEGFHPPVEEYLKVTYELEEEGIPVIRARLADRLGHSAPTVTEMVRRLVDDGYLEVRERSLHLTESGRQRAEGVVRKHRVAERLLVDIIGLPWHKAHAEAGNWEHVISEEVEDRLLEVLGNPDTCPHGNPIPGTGEGSHHLQRLAVAEPGEQVCLERISESVELDLDTLLYLEHHGLRPGATARVEDRAPDDTLTLSVDGQTVAVAVSPVLAAQLHVRAE
jgi:DtxR family transcriptional regulator, Mn-dependent transcriptional regulator